MDKKEEFKEFIRTKPELVSFIKDKKYTWQDFYEVFDIYGTSEEVWTKYTTETKTTDKLSSVAELTDLVKNINMDTVQKYVNNAQKAINIITELTAKKGVGNTVEVITKTPRVINKFFGD